jgi:hypothetical protein
LTKAIIEEEDDNAAVATNTEEEYTYKRPAAIREGYFCNCCYAERGKIDITPSRHERNCHLRRWIHANSVEFRGVP